MDKLAVVTGDQTLLKYLQIKRDKTGKNTISVKEILEDFSKIEKAATEEQGHKRVFYDGNVQELEEDLGILHSVSHISLNNDSIEITPLGYHFARQYDSGLFERYQEYF